MSFPRSDRGTVDDGHHIGGKENCPNCGSLEYFQTVSTEQCPSCGLYFDYWGGGGNGVYNQMRDKDQEEWERKQNEES